jgi:ABC-type multidrug transport system permease subunit
MKAFIAVYLREILILKSRLKRQIASMCISPFLYLITFGYALGGTVTIEGHSYLEFLLPGLIAMATMTQSFSIATDINVARFYFHSFEEIQAAPVGRLSYVLGETMAGITRSLLSVFIIIILGYLFGVKLKYGLFFWLAIFLNSFTFAALAVAMAMIVKSHADQSLLTNFIITPMAFLGGTFFPLENLPYWAQKILLILPLSHAAQAIRVSSFAKTPEIQNFLVLMLSSIIFMALAILTVSRAKD